MSCEVYDLFACIVTAAVTTFARVKNSYGEARHPAAPAICGDAQISWRLMCSRFISQPEAQPAFPAAPRNEFYSGNLAD